MRLVVNVVLTAVKNLWWKVPVDLHHDFVLA
jgi:hypothetical protein